MYATEVDYPYFEWVTEGQKVNPAAGAKLAQSTYTAAGWYRAQFWITGSGTHTTSYKVGIYNQVTGWGVNHIVRVGIDRSEFFKIRDFFYLPDLTAFRVEALTALTGTVQATILVHRKVDEPE